MGQEITGLRDALRETDPSSKAALESLAHTYGANVLDDLVILTASDETEVSRGASWLLKRALESGACLSDAQLVTVIQISPDAAHWETALHICQSIRFANPEKSTAQRAGRWLAPYLDHKRPFLRAWSLDGLCALAALFPRLKSDAEAALEKGREDPAASVRARARRLQKEIEKASEP